MQSWIIMRSDLFADPRVQFIADALGITRYHVIGILCHLWLYAHQHGERSGAEDIEVQCRPSDINTLFGHAKFYDELKAYGWIEAHPSKPGMMIFPKLLRHVPDHRTVAERKKATEEARESKREKMQDWRKRGPVERTPERMVAKIEKGYTDAQMRTWGWLGDKEASAEYLESQGWRKGDDGKWCKP